MTTTPWNSWEDWHAGLYAARPVDSAMVKLSVALLADRDQFREVASEMVRAWPNGARHGIGDLPDGARAWVGQSSCCYAHGASGRETREAWGLLTDAQRSVANAIADDVVERWRKDVVDGAQALFDS